MIDATGWGQRIREAIYGLQAQLGHRYTLEMFGRDVGMLERGKAWSASAVSEWIAERSEPGIATFIAMARVVGHQNASYLLLGIEAGRSGLLPPRVIEELPPALPHEKPPPESAEQPARAIPKRANRGPR